MTFLNSVINECLRFNSPTQHTATCVFAKDTKAGGYNFKAGEKFVINQQHLHHNPNEYKNPEKLLPERFDPSNELFKTPSGK